MPSPKKQPEIPNPFDQPGLTEQLLCDVMRAGEARRNLATKIDAPTRGGSEAWFDKVAAIRTMLIPFGWTYSNDDGFCTVVSPDGVHAIAIVKGSMGTGDPDGEPETSRKMGPATIAVVAENQAQCSFFFASPAAKDAPRLTWLLLWRRSGDLVRLELSLPDTESNGYVCGWKKRYPLTDVNMQPPAMDDSDDRGDDDGAYDVDVDHRG